MIYGYDEGLEVGVHETQVSIAKQLINSDMPIKEVMKITGLTKEEIEKIK